MRENLIDALVDNAVSEEKRQRRIRVTLVWPLAVWSGAMATFALFSLVIHARFDSTVASYAVGEPGILQFIRIAGNPWIIGAFCALTIASVLLLVMLQSRIALVLRLTSGKLYNNVFTGMTIVLAVAMAVLYIATFLPTMHVLNNLR